MMAKSRAINHRIHRSNRN